MLEKREMYCCWPIDDGFVIGQNGVEVTGGEIDVAAFACIAVV